MAPIRPIGPIWLALALFASNVTAAELANFYQGKTVRIVVGLAAGGGYDLYARTLARHLGKHIPGNPAVVVENMTGAGSIIAANYLYKIAKPDGLTIGHYLGGIALKQLLGKSGIEFDALRFKYIGVPAQDSFIIGVHKATGITDVNAWIASKQLIKFGGIGPGAGSDDIPKILAATINLPAQVVAGYKGTAETRLAFNNGEVQATSNAWESTKSTWRNELDSGTLKVVLQATLKSHPELKQIPVAYELAKTDEAKKLMATVLRANSPTVRPFMAPPATPNDRVQLLRKAFMDTWKDPELVAETKKARLDIDPADGAELEQNIKEIFKLEPSQIAKLKEILK
ncbi:MAG TPA: tripartite tricarboxylate transporter substrate-binding protein [Candidatus Deferrimicrobium sp.]|nr:tripartite tricarboxylate transporter substrate-binding protein [Candidatus Deferrimicrobium sp.]